MGLNRSIIITVLSLSFLASCGSHTPIEDVKFTADSPITLDASKKIANIALDWTPNDHSIECNNFTFELKNQSIASTVTIGEITSRPLNLTITFNEALSADDTGDLKFHFNDKTAKKEGEDKVIGINVKLPVDPPEPTIHHISMVTPGTDIVDKDLPFDKDYESTINVTNEDKILDGLSSVILKDNNTDITEYCTYKQAIDNKSASLNIALMYLTHDIEVSVKLISALQITHTVTFDSKDGSYTPDSQTIIEGRKASRPIDDPTKDGYTFGGWYTDETATEYKYDFSRPVITDLALYARWDEISELATVTFDAGEGIFFNGEHTFSIQVDTNSELNLCLNIMRSREPTWEGNTFAYYSYQDTSKHLSYNDIVTSDVTIVANYFSTTKLPYTDLNAISWEAIKNVAITKKDISEVFKIGATKDIKFNGVKHTVRLLDFHKDSLHYDKSPTVLSPKTAGITFEFSSVISKSSGLADEREWDSTGNNHFSKSTLNTLLNDSQKTDSIFNKLPDDLKPLVEKVDKKVGEADSTTYEAITYNPMLFLLAHNEMFDNDKYVTSNEGSKYQYYKDNTSQDARKKKDSKGNVSSYWLRSPCLDHSVSTGKYEWVWRVTESGVDYYQSDAKYNLSHAFAPAFCI